MNTSRFRIIIIRHQWSCGDGDCFDSGYKLFCQDFETKQFVFSNVDWYYHPCWGELFGDALIQMEQMIGHVPLENTDYVFEVFGETNVGGNLTEYPLMFSDVEWEREF